MEERITTDGDSRITDPLSYRQRHSHFGGCTTPGPITECRRQLPCERRSNYNGLSPQPIWFYDMATTAMTQSPYFSYYNHGHDPINSYIRFYNMATGALTKSRFSRTYIHEYYDNYVKTFSRRPFPFSVGNKLQTDDGKQVGKVVRYGTSQFCDEITFDVHVTAAQRNMLLICCLPFPAMASSLAAVFGGYMGFRGLWMTKGYHGIALAEYEDEYCCTTVMERLQGFEIKPLKTLIIYRVK